MSCVGARRRPRSARLHRLVTTSDAETSDPSRKRRRLRPALDIYSRRARPTRATVSRPATKCSWNEQELPSSCPSREEIALTARRREARLCSRSPTAGPLQHADFCYAVRREVIEGWVLRRRTGRPAGKWISTFARPAPDFAACGRERLTSTARRSPRVGDLRKRGVSRRVSISTKINSAVRGCAVRKPITAGTVAAVPARTSPPLI